MSGFRVRSRALLLTAIGAVLTAFFANALPLIQAGGSVDFVDAAGRNIKLERAPRRILVIGNGPFIIAHMLYMFPQGRERLVGMERKGKTASDFLPLIDSGFEKKIFLSPNPGPEQIAGLHPDLVLTRGTAPDAKAAALAEIGIPVAFLGLETPAQYQKDVETLGRILENPSRAKEISSYFQGRIEAVAQALAGPGQAVKPRVLLALVIARGGKIAVEVPALSWMQTLQVKAAGGDPVWSEAAEPSSGWTVVNLEQIARWNPDKIILVVWHSMDPGKTLEDLRTDPHWSALHAVRTGSLHAFPSDLYGWDTPDPRWALGLLWLAKTIRPERFPDLDIDREIELFYAVLYGLDKAAVEAKIRPFIHFNYR